MQTLQMLTKELNKSKYLDASFSVGQNAIAITNAKTHAVMGDDLAVMFVLKMEQDGEMSLIPYIADEGWELETTKLQMRGLQPSTLRNTLEQDMINMGFTKENQKPQQPREKKMTIIELQEYLSKSNVMTVSRDYVNDAVLVYPAKKHALGFDNKYPEFSITIKDEKTVIIVSLKHGTYLEHAIHGLRGSLEYDIKYLGFTR